MHRAAGRSIAVHPPIRYDVFMAFFGSNVRWTECRQRTPRSGCLIVAFMVCSVWSCGSSAQTPDEIAFFEKKIRPVLVEHCYKCHSAEAEADKKLKGALFLDQRAGVLRGGESGPAVVRGKPGESLLLEALSWENEDLRMPPKSRLSETVVADFRRWIELGVPDPRKGGPPSGRPGVSLEEGRKLWAFQPLVRPDLPKVKDTEWAWSELDRFILARLEIAGLRPNPPTDREKWIRRAYLDLIGLPPTPAEIQAFVEDPTPAARQRVVDRLLGSPHYGERWGRHWLDLARWAESSGYENDNDRPHAWHYRDFVIWAFNTDLPYDKFVQWQIAGDEIAPGNARAEKATGFLAAGPMNGQVTQREAEKERYDVLDDWVHTIGTSMLGLTVGCARCHDHKFDPLPVQDYYSLVSTFASTVRVNRNVIRDPATQQRDAWRRAHQRLVEARTRYEEKEVRPRAPSLSLEELPDSPLWVVLVPEEIVPGGNQAEVTTRFEQRADGASCIVEANGEIAQYTVRLRTQLQDLRALRLEVLPDERLPNSGPGLGDFGEFNLTRFSLTVARTTGGPAADVALPTARDTLKRFQDGSWSFTPDAPVPQAAVFEFESPVGFDGGSVLDVTMRFRADNPGGRKALGCFRISVATGCIPTSFDGPEIGETALLRARQALARLPEEHSVLQRESLVQLAARHDVQWRRLDRAVRTSRAERPWPKYDVALTTTEANELVPYRLKIQGPDFYQNAYLLRRGNPELKLQEAQPGFLRVLLRDPNAVSKWIPSDAAAARTSYRRAALARWLTDVDSGAGALLARVIVNRLWQHHLGHGIVTTPSDFGAQGARPTHPELLDWLASELIARQWSLKAVHRSILLSAVYAQGTQSDEERRQKDPENTLWWRRAQRRLESEILRDSMLAVSGRLDKSLFGPGTLDESSVRRSIYFRVKRSQLIPSLVQLDWPDTLAGLGKRPVTTVAPQALLMLNGPHVRASAEAFSGRLTEAAGRSLNAAVSQAYWLALGRDPSEAEMRASSAFIRQQSETYDSPDARARALADFCQTLFSLNEFFYIP